MATRLTLIRGAEVVFERRDGGHKYVILACTGFEGEGWEQWGAPTEVLGDNVGEVSHWREGLSEEALR